MTTGLVMFGAAFLLDLDRRRRHVRTPTVIVPQMVLMGLGMGLISTPATESILLVLPPARAGVGSAVNDATRELGGTLGVAVVGLDLLQRLRRQLADGLLRQHAAAYRSSRPRTRSAWRRPSRSLVPALTGAMQDAFLAGLQTSCIVIGLLCLVGALVAVVALPGRIRRADESSARRGAGARDGLLTVSGHRADGPKPHPRALRWTGAMSQTMTAPARTGLDRYGTLVGTLVLATISVVGAVISVRSDLADDLLDAMGPVGRLSIPLPMLVAQVIAGVASTSLRKWPVLIGTGFVAVTTAMGVISGFFDGGYAEDRLTAFERTYQMLLAIALVVVAVVAVRQYVRNLRR